MEIASPVMVPVSVPVPAPESYENRFVRALGGASLVAAQLDECTSLYAWRAADATRVRPSLATLEPGGTRSFVARQLIPLGDRALLVPEHSHTVVEWSVERERTRHTHSLVLADTARQGPDIVCVAPLSDSEVLGASERTLFRATLDARQRTVSLRNQSRGSLGTNEWRLVRGAALTCVCALVDGRCATANKRGELALYTRAGERAKLVFRLGAGGVRSLAASVDGTYVCATLATRVCVVGPFTHSAAGEWTSKHATVAVAHCRHAARDGGERGGGEYVGARVRESSTHSDVVVACGSGMLAFPLARPRHRGTETSARADDARLDTLHKALKDAARRGASEIDFALCARYEATAHVVDHAPDDGGGETIALEHTLVRLRLH